MNLQRLWCVLVIIAFSMPALAATPEQLASFDNIASEGWVETGGGAPQGTYMEQALVGAPNEVNESTGSMKFDFTEYVSGERDDEVTMTFGTAKDWSSNWGDLAVTVWVWTRDPNNTVDYLVSLKGSRLQKIILNDGSARVGVFTLPHLTDIGWNKVIAPLRNFIWDNEATDPTVVDWDDITKIVLWARTEHVADHNAIYVDDLRLDYAPTEPTRPYQLASFDSIWDELWYEDHGNTLMVQAPPGEVNEGTGSVMCDFNNHGASDWDIRPGLPLIPALDITDANWAISLWVWSDLVLDAYFWELTLIDVMGNTGRCRVPRADINTGYGWNKITIGIDELVWSDGGDYANLTSSQVKLDTIVALELWCMSFPYWGNSIYLDDLRIEADVELPSDANVYNADKATITVDGSAADWAGLDSNIIDFDLATINYEEPSWADAYSGASPWPHTGTGDLHVKYRLAWDDTYLYILVEEQTGDNSTNEAADDDWLMSGGLNAAGTFYDSLALAFDFTNNRIPGNEMHISFWLWLGLSSTDANDLIGCLVNQDRANYDAEAKAALVGSKVETSGTRPSRVIEAAVKWSVLETAIDSWWHPAGGIAAAVQAGYTFGCDPRLLDTEDLAAPWNSTHSMGWFSGVDDPVGWPQGYYRWPTGRDAYSIDIKLVETVDCFPSDHPDYSEWANVVGKPDCWCYPRQCYGDADGQKQGLGAGKWVLTDDLTTMRAAWNKSFATIDGQVDENGVELICADFDHDAQGLGAGKRVLTDDLQIMRDHWNITGGPDPNCYTGGPPYPDPDPNP